MDVKIIDGDSVLETLLKALNLSQVEEKPTPVTVAEAKEWLEGLDRAGKGLMSATRRIRAAIDPDSGVSAHDAINLAQVHSYMNMAGVAMSHCSNLLEDFVKHAESCPCHTDNEAKTEEKNTPEKREVPQDIKDLARKTAEKIADSIFGPTIAKAAREMRDAVEAAAKAAEAKTEPPPAPAPEPVETRAERGEEHQTATVFASGSAS